MLLNRVCSLWRSVALSSPRIWTRLHIPLPGNPSFPSPYGSNVDRALEPRRQMFSKTMQLRCQAVKEWLDRSGSCPLSLSISCPLGHSPITTNYIDRLPTLEALSIDCPQFTTHLLRHRNRWGRLTDICFKSPATDTDLFEMLKQCHNLIILDVESLKLRETGPASSAFCAIDAPHLKSLLYKCPRRYVDGSLHASFLTPESLIWLISNTTASLETLYIDPRPLQLEHVLQCLRLAAHVKELIIGEPFFPNVQDSENIHPGRLFNLEPLLVPFTVRTTEHEGSTSSSTPFQNDILLPNLESLEANDLYVIADSSLCKILTSRIDAVRLGLTSPLRRVKMPLEGQKWEDILPEIVARARDAGMAMKLDLVYRPPAYDIGPLSPSFLSPGLCTPFNQIYH